MSKDEIIKLYFTIDVINTMDFHLNAKKFEAKCVSCDSVYATLGDYGDGYNYEIRIVGRFQCPDDEGGYLEEINSGIFICKLTFLHDESDEIVGVKECEVKDNRLDLTKSIF